MSAFGKTGENSFVVLQIGNRRIAVPAEIVAELAPPVRLHTFPHSSRYLTGVIVRRGRIVPVYDASSVLGARSSLTQKFYLILRRQVGTKAEFGAIPVSGECALATSHMQPRSNDQPAHIAGTVAVANESLDVLNFDGLIASTLHNDSSLAEAQS
jgi:chemotaxis signal transduction protein